MSYALWHNALRYEHQITPQHPLEPEAPGPSDLPAIGAKAPRLKAQPRGYRGSGRPAAHP